MALLPRVPLQEQGAYESDWPWMCCRAPGVLLCLPRPSRGQGPSWEGPMSLPCSSMLEARPASASAFQALLEPRGTLWGCLPLHQGYIWASSVAMTTKARQHWGNVGSGEAPPPPGVWHSSLRLVPGRSQWVAGAVQHEGHLCKVRVPPGPGSPTKSHSLESPRFQPGCSLLLGSANG